MGYGNGNSPAGRAAAATTWLVGTAGLGWIPFTRLDNDGLGIAGTGRPPTELVSIALSINSWNCFPDNDMFRIAAGGKNSTLSNVSVIRRTGGAEFSVLCFDATESTALEGE